MFFLKVLFIVILIALILVIFVFALRFFNTQKYKPKDFTENHLKVATDTFKYNTNIDGVDVSRIEGEYINGFGYYLMKKTCKGVIILFVGSFVSLMWNMATIGTIRYRTNYESAIIRVQKIQKFTFKKEPDIFSLDMALFIHHL